MATKRAYGVTTSEISAVLWSIGFIVGAFGIKNLITLQGQIAPVNQGIAMTIGFCVGLVAISLFFGFMSMVLPNYAITKWNLNIFIDKITNPDFIGWVRCTRDRGIRFHTVKTGTHGKTNGVVNDEKASVINNGDYTVTAPNGNKLIFCHDLISQNDNLEENIGWNLISKHYGIIGYKAYEKAVEMGRLLFKGKQKPIDDDADSVEGDF